MLYTTISVPITHCTKCDINWSVLYLENDDENNETHEICPKCLSRFDLKDGTDIVSYKPCRNTGKIINSDTGELHSSEIQTPVISINSKILVWDESVEEYKKRAAEIEDATPLNVPVPRVDRKCHFE